MEIAYNYPDLKSEIEPLAEDLRRAGLGCEINFKREIDPRFFYGNEKGSGTPPPELVGMGAIPPEGWVDLGKYAISFIVSPEIVRGVLGGALWDAMKLALSKGFSLVKSKDKLHHSEKAEMFIELIPNFAQQLPYCELVLITDRVDFSKALDRENKTIMFVFGARMEEAEVSAAIEAIPQARQGIKDFLKVSDIRCVNAVARFIFIDGGWRLDF